MPMGNSLLKGLSALAGIGGLVFSFFLLTWPGMTDRQIAQPVSTIQMDPVARAVQLAEQTVQQTEQAVQLSQRACIRMVDPVGIVLDSAAPHLNLKVLVSKS